MRTLQAVPIAFGLAASSLLGGFIVARAKAPSLTPPRAAVASLSLQDGSLGQVKGTILSMDPKGSRIVLQLSFGQSPLQIDQDTTIFVRGRLGHLSDLSIGQLVCATFEPPQSFGQRASLIGLAQWIEPCGP